MTNQKCPACQANAEPISKSHVMNTDIVLYQCTNCEMAFRSPLPSKAKIANYYNSKPYFRYDDLLEEKNAKGQLQWLHKHLVAKNLSPDDYEFIEFGTGDSFLLNEMKKLGYKVSGYEADPDSVKQAETMFDISINNTFFTPDMLSQIQVEKKVIFALSHVLEHLLDPLAFISELKKNFPGAYLFIEVPNGYFELPAITIDQSPKSSLNEHLWQFTTASFEKIFATRSINVVETSTIGKKNYYAYHLTLWRAYEELDTILEKVKMGERTLFQFWLSSAAFSIKYMYIWLRLRLSALVFGQITRPFLPSIRILVEL